MPIELHCHTLFSVDAHGSPESLVEEAYHRGVKTLAITEHNNLHSHERGARHAEKYGIQYLAGIEFDAIWNGRQFHFVGLGVDPGDTHLQQLSHRHLAVYTRFHDLVLEEMAALGFPVSSEQLQEDYALRYPTHPCPVPNVWHLRDFYPRRSGFDPVTVEEALKVATREAKKRPSTPPSIGHFDEVSRTVRESGGIFLLAHVAKYFPGDATAQIQLIDELMDAGLDGFELYHPRNLAEPHFDQLRNFAESHQYLTSGGSDSHSTPGEIGTCGAPDSLIEPLLEAIETRSHQHSRCRGE